MYENIKQREDGSYVFDKHGFPYHCPNEGEWIEEYAQVDAWAKANPGQIVQEILYVPSQEELNSNRVILIDAEISALERKQARPTREWLLDSTNTVAAEAVQSIETQIIALREERALLLAA